jgi:hypothetical protein
VEAGGIEPPSKVGASEAPTSVACLYSRREKRRQTGSPTTSPFGSRWSRLRRRLPSQPDLSTSFWSLPARLLRTAAGYLRSERVLIRTYLVAVFLRGQRHLGSQPADRPALSNPFAPRKVFPLYPKSQAFTPALSLTFSDRCPDIFSPYFRRKKPLSVQFRPYT